MLKASQSSAVRTPLPAIGTDEDEGLGATLPADASQPSPPDSLHLPDPTEVAVDIQTEQGWPISLTLYPFYPKLKCKLRRLHWGGYRRWG